jgi:hypothetical protein
VTVIEERRRDVNLIAGLLIVAFAFAAVRGASQAPILAGVMGVLAVVSLGIWLRWRLSAPRRLTISEKEITFGRPGRVTIRVPRTDGPLVLRSTRSSRWLASSGGPGIPMLGYDLDDVRRACVSHAWEFTTG